MENEKFISQELEEMRSQIDILKNQLEKQVIVNDSHIRNSMKSKASDINRTVGATIFLGVIALIYCTWFFYSQGLSLLFVIATAIMLATCIILTIAQKAALGKLDFSSDNIVETAKILGKIKTHYSEWHRIAIPMILIWFGWLIYEVISTLGPSPMTIGFCCGAFIGGILGGIMGFRINRKVVRKASEILSQIEELKNEA